MSCDIQSIVENALSKQVNDLGKPLVDGQVILDKKFFGLFNDDISRRLKAEHQIDSDENVFNVTDATRLASRPDTYGYAKSYYYTRWTLNAPLVAKLEANRRNPPAPSLEELGVKPGVEELFESNPELASIGTPQQYSQYLDTIFPNSQVKDIVYHGGKVNKESFKRFVDKTKYEDRNPNSSLGFFFSSSKNTVAGQYAEKDYDAIKDQLTGDAETDSFIRRSAPLKKGSVSEELLNIKKPYIIQAEEWENETWVDTLNILSEKDKDSNWVSDYKWTVDAYEKVKNYLQSLGYDGLYINSNKELFNKTGIVDYITVQKVVFEPEQIHILGNKQDIEGFKEFVTAEEAQEEYFDSKQREEQLSDYYMGDTALMEQESKDLDRFRDENSNMPDEDIDDYFTSCK